MNSEVQLYLSARRPGGQDDEDPAIADALAKARADSALSAWAENQQRVDAALAFRLGSVELPPGLRERIIAGGKVSRRTWQRSLNRTAFGILRYWEVTAIAAILMVCAVFSLVHFLGRDGAGNWQLTAAAEVGRIESATRPLDHEVGDIAEIRRWLAEHRAPAPGNLPATLQGFAPHGCAIVQTGGNAISIVCFDLGGGKEVHLATISRAHLRSSPPEGSPRFEKIDGYTTAAWSDGSLAMMLVGKVDESDLRKLFAAKTAAARWGGLPVRNAFVLRPARVPRSS